MMENIPTTTPSIVKEVRSLLFKKATLKEDEIGKARRKLLIIAGYQLFNSATVTVACCIPI